MDRTFARLSIVAAILFLVIVLALMFLAPEVDALKYGISFYALTDFRAVIGVAIARFAFPRCSWESRCGLTYKSLVASARLC